VGFQKAFINVPLGRGLMEFRQYIHYGNGTTRKVLTVVVGRSV